MFIILIPMNMKKIADYSENTAVFRAIGDENRLKIIDMLSNGEICACEILLELEITQSTLSHHMKILCDSSLVIPRKAGKWTFYSMNKATVKKLKEFVNVITKKKEGYIPKKNKGGCE